MIGHRVDDCGYVETIEQGRRVAKNAGEEKNTSVSASEEEVSKRVEADLETKDKEGELYGPWMSVSSVRRSRAQLRWNQVNQAGGSELRASGGN